MKNYIFDIDGTLTLVGDRVNDLKKSPPDWDSFYNRCGEDEPNQPILDILTMVIERYLHDTNSEYYFVTGRRESCREDTIAWFREKGFYIDSERLYMRPDEDHRHDSEIKPELLKDAGIEPYLIFEDRASMVKTWRDLGYCCVQVAEGDF